MSDDWVSAAYWYQTLPSPVLTLPPVEQRLPTLPGERPAQRLSADALTAEQGAAIATADARYAAYRRENARLTPSGRVLLVQRTALQQAQARHIPTRPYTPRTNGKAERFIQTSLREWAYAKPYASSAERSQAISLWADTYNLVRPHAGMEASAHGKS